MRHLIIVVISLFLGTASGQALGYTLPGQSEPIHGGDYRTADETQGGNSIKSAPKLNVTLPSKRNFSEYYYVQPVNVVLENVQRSDELASLQLRVRSNPAEHQHVFSVQFAKGTKVTSVGTRVRLAGERSAIVEAVAKTRAGKLITATANIRLKKGVDFSDHSSLTMRLRANVKGLAGPIGTARTRVSKKSKYARQLSAIIYHPMVSSVQNANPISHIAIRYDGRAFGEFEIGDAISNDPYVDIFFTDSKSGDGPLHVQWTEMNGRAYESKAGVHH